MTPLRSRPRAAVLAVVAALVAIGLAPGAGPQAVRAADAGAPGGRLIVFWKAGHGPHLTDGRIATATTVTGRAGRRSLVVARPGTAGSLAAQLRADPGVAAVIPDARLTTDAWPASGPPDDPLYASHQADLGAIGVPTAWQTTTGSPSVIVAIIDTGTTTNQQDLAGTTFVSPWNVITGTAGAVDDYGHGTHVTGTIAAQANNNLGIAGIAPGVAIMPIKALDASGSGSFNDFLSAIDYAVAHGAKVINLSIGGVIAPEAAAAAQPTIDAAHAAGVTIVAAAGNDGNSTVDYPCAFNHVICVGATDNAGSHASFSNANAFVDISAPGVGIESTLAPIVQGCSGSLSCYGLMDGTSMATPHVAAIAALVLSAHPSDTPDQVEATLETTARDLGTAARDDVFGYGLVDAAAAVAASPSAAAPAAPGAPSSASAPGAAARPDRTLDDSAVRPEPGNEHERGLRGRLVGDGQRRR